MTREEAIYQLMGLMPSKEKIVNSQTKKHLEALSMAIRALESNPWHKASEELPPHFGDYLVIIDSKLYGRRFCIKCWFGNPKDCFGDNPSKEWVLEADERVSYWMPIPELSKED